MFIYDIAEILGQSYPRAFTHENVASGFRAAGIHPSDKDIFKDEDFMAAYVTDRSNPENEDLDDAVADGTCSSAANNDQGSADQLHSPLLLPQYYMRSIWSCRR